MSLGSDNAIAERSQLTREDSLELEKESLQPDDDQELEQKYSLDDLNLPPGRMHATRVKERLSGSLSNLQVPASLHHKRVGSTGDRSRSKSPSMGTSRTPTATQTDANSSISSLDDIVDQDILYDRAGLVELDLTESQRKLHNSREFVNLPPVSERLSEDTLEDCHAFSDVVRSSNASRVSGGTGTDVVLEPLDEGDEDDDELDDIDEGDESAPAPTVILTNMENLTLQSGASAAAGASVGVSRTGESSVGQEAPSGPTA